MDAEKIVALAKQTAPEMLWKGPFIPLGNAKVESKFADHRTYFYEKKEVDQQVHLGFDLAVTKQIPVLAGNDGKVVYADYLGIYGNCVIIDHGMGVQSLYGHLSSIDVKPGDIVTRGQQIGRSGMTGLAARRPPALLDPAAGQPREPGGVVGPALDRRPGDAQAARVRLRAQGSGLRQGRLKAQDSGLKLSA